MHRRNTLVSVLALALVTLSACGEDGDGTSAGSEPSASQSSDPVLRNDPDISRELLEAIRTSPKEGGRLTAQPGSLAIELMAGETGSAASLIRNVGDETVTIDSVTPLVESPGLSVSDRGCTAGRVLDPETACEVRVTWRDQDGRSVSSGVLLESDARQTPRLSIPLSVSVEQPPEEPKPDCALRTVQLCGKELTVPELRYGEQHSTSAGHSLEKTWICTRDGLSLTQESGQCAAPKPKAPEVQRRGATTQMILQARRARLNADIGSAQRGETDDFGAVSGRAERGRVGEQTGYDREVFRSADTSLPVDRSRILTEDRIIKAVLETPFSNVMCGRVMAQVESNVYAPEGTNILIPAGTRFIGECKNFAATLGGGRAMLHWKRFITPDGVSARISSYSADANGLGGIPGHVDRRWLDRYGIPLVFSGLNSLVTLGLSDGTQTTTNAETGQQTTDESAASKAADQFTETARELGGQLQEELQDVQQTMVVPSGTRFDITLSQDLYFKSPHEVVNVGGETYRLADNTRKSGQLEPAEQAIGNNQVIEINGKKYRYVPTPSESAGQRNSQPADANADNTVETYGLGGGGAQGR